MTVLTKTGKPVASRSNHLALTAVVGTQAETLTPEAEDRPATRQRIAAKAAGTVADLQAEPKRSTAARKAAGSRKA